MFRHVFPALILSALLVGASDAGTITLSGAITLGGGAVGDPPGYVGPGGNPFPFMATIEYLGSATSPAPVTTGSVDLTAAGFPAPFVFPVGTVTVSGLGVADTVLVSLFGPTTPPSGGSSITFSFANGDVISDNAVSFANLLAIIPNPTTTITAGGAFFATSTPPATLSVDAVAITAAAVVAPEPSSFALLAVLSLGGAGWYRRRRKLRP